MLRLSLRTRRTLLPWLFIGPGLLWLLLFFAYPLAATVYFSFFRYNLFQLHPVGLTNYRFLFKDPYAWTAIKNTLWLVVVMVPIVRTDAFQRVVDDPNDAAMVGTPLT